jgi:hypothetical protein
MAIIVKANAQTWEEWTEQKETQIKYLVQQIAAFQTYLGYARQGYEIAHKGITTVENIKNGEWNLHKDFFGSLKTVNPVIKNSAKVTDIIALQVGLVKTSRILIDECRQNGQVTSQEIAYLENVCNKLLLESLKNIDELIMVITSGELQMKDDERINQIEKIYADMKEKQVFFRSFGSSLIRLLKNRSHEKFEIELFKTLKNVK